MNDIRRFLTQKQVSSYEKKIVFMGLLISTIFDKSEFKKNEDLHTYISFYEHLFDIKDGFKPYVYKSRTLLASRVVRLVNQTEDITVLTKIFNYHISFFYKNKKNSSSLQNETLLGDYINGERNVKK